jgi:hypothetical protein
MHQRQRVQQVLNDHPTVSIVRSEQSRILFKVRGTDEERYETLAELRQQFSVADAHVAEGDDSSDDTYAIPVGLSSPSPQTPPTTTPISTDTTSTPASA